MLQELKEVIGSDLISGMADDKQVEEDRLSAYSSDLDAPNHSYDIVLQADLCDGNSSDH